MNMKVLNISLPFFILSIVATAMLGVLLTAKPVEAG